jgi:hypothetical protein
LIGSDPFHDDDPSADRTFYTLAAAIRRVLAEEVNA